MEKELITENIKTIRDAIFTLRYASRTNGGVEIHSSDQQNFRDAAEKIDTAARTIAVILELD